MDTVLITGMLGALAWYAYPQPFGAVFAVMVAIVIPVAKASGRAT